MDEIITASFWETLCDQSWSMGQEVVDNSMVFCPLEGVLDFFNYISKTDKKVILVSAYSDYGLHYQNENHPNMDLSKMLGRYQWKEIAQVKDRYLTPTIESAEYAKCNPRDKFIVKMDSWTGFTFNKIPDNIKTWVTTNCNVNEPNMGILPFGVNEQGEGKNLVQKHYKKEKSKLLYINFQNYTGERLALKEFYQQKNYDWVTLKMDVGTPVEEFYSELADHEFVLCPFGNGLDSYRMYETLAVGSIPIIRESRFSSNLGTFCNFPSVTYNTLFGITKEHLLETKEKFVKIEKERGEWDRANISKNIWKNTLEELKRRYNKVD